MSDPYLGEVRMFGGNFAPSGWSLCDGSLLPINQNSALFSLLGTTYGGDGINSFGLPDLRGRVPLHQGPGYALGQRAGSETASVSVAQLGAHTHVVNATSAAASPTAGPNGMLAAATLPLYGSGATTAMAAPSTSQTGGADAHENMAPFQVVSFIIALEGIYPTPT